MRRIIIVVAVMLASLALAAPAFAWVLSGGSAGRQAARYAASLGRTVASDPTWGGTFAGSDLRWCRRINSHRLACMIEDDFAMSDSSDRVCTSRVIVSKLAKSSPVRVRYVLGSVYCDSFGNLSLP